MSLIKLEDPHMQQTSSANQSVEPSKQMGIASGVQGQAGFGRLWQYNKTEWPHGLMGCAGSLGLGFMMPGMAYCMSSIISVLYNPDPATMQREVSLYPALVPTKAAQRDDILQPCWQSSESVTSKYNAQHGMK